MESFVLELRWIAGTLGCSPLLTADSWDTGLISCVWSLEAKRMTISLQQTSRSKLFIIYFNFTPFICQMNGKVSITCVINIILLSLLVFFIANWFSFSSYSLSFLSCRI